MVRLCAPANFFPEWTFICVESGIDQMDERRTLSLLAWSIGGVVGIMFLLNGLALSLLPPPGLAARHAAAPPANAAATLRLARNAPAAARGVE
jgi:hypothetical protein